MVRVEYVVEQGIAAPVWLFIAMGVLLVIGVLVITIGKWVAHSEGTVTAGIVISVAAFVVAAVSLMGTSYTDFTDEEAARVAVEIGRVACVDVSETDVILMYKNKDDVIPFEFDKMGRDGKNYFVMEGQC